MGDKEKRIDFVLLWVDGNDPEWQKRKQVYSPDKGQDNSANRYREWENLKYWFRGVEKFAPWVGTIHFVTCGQCPEWLNTEHPKLHMVDHTDFIPADCLPTFSSRAIDLNLHRIEELSEHFVYFNDDMFLTSAVEPEDFFRDGLPCDIWNERPICFASDRGAFDHTQVNNFHLIDRHFARKQVLKQNRRKIVTLKYGALGIYNLIASGLPFQHFFGLYGHHLPMGYLKQHWREVWEAEPEVMNETIHHKFRSMTDVNQFVFRYWALMKGEFAPLNMNRVGKNFSVGEDNRALYQAIEQQKYKTICINDTCTQEQYEKAKPEVIRAFEQILPEKSQFEK